MGFLGYRAIIWLCFPRRPYMYAGRGGERGTDSLSELGLLVCIAWLPSAPASFCCPRLPLGNEVRESFLVMRKIKAAPVVYPDEEERPEGAHVCGTGCRHATAVPPGALAGGCVAHKPPDAPFGAISRAICPLSDKLKKPVVPTLCR